MAKKNFNLKKRLSPQFTVKSSRTPESRIDIFNAIGCPNDNDFPTVVQTIHESQEGRNNGGMDLIISTRSYRGQAINFIEKNYGWAHYICLIKK